MKLTLLFLNDLLKEFHPECRCKNPKHEFSGVRLYQTEQEKISYALYIGYSDDFFHDKKRQVVCKTENDYLRLETDDLTTILNRIQDAISFYSLWYDARIDEIENGCSLDELASYASEIIGLPLMIFNAAQILIAHSSGLELTEWPDDLENLQKYSSLPTEKLILFNQQHIKSFYSSEQYKISAGFFKTKSYCRHVFSKSGERIGTTVLRIVDKDATYSQLFLFNKVINLIEKWVHGSRENRRTFLLSSHFLSSLEDDDSIIQAVLERQLSLMGWDINCRKQVLILSMPNNSISFIMDLAFDLTLGNIAIFPIPYQSTLVLLCNLDLLQADFIPRLREQLIKNDNCAYSSFIFTDLSFFITAYQQTLTGLNLGSHISGILYSYKDIAMNISAKIIKENATGPIIHPALFYFNKYDIEHGTEIMQTLFCYLRNGCQKVITSQELFIHRNTLSLRLEKIQELWPLDFDDPDERFYLLFSFYIFKSES